jgi:hypothetical protein
VALRADADLPVRSDMSWPTWSHDAVQVPLPLWFEEG